MRIATLHTGTASGLPVVGDRDLAFAAPPAKPVWGFAYTPAACRFFRVTGDGRCLYRSDEGGTQRDRPARLGEAYEVRLFCEQWEVRWLRQGSEGRIAFLSEGEPEEVYPDLKVLFGAEDLTMISHQTRTTDHAYLLWGEKAEEPAGGWTRLTSARIGTLFVPWELKRPETRLQFRAREYFREADDGNVVLIAERLLGFRSAENRERSKTSGQEATHA